MCGAVSPFATELRAGEAAVVRLHPPDPGQHPPLQAALGALAREHRLGPEVGVERREGDAETGDGTAGDARRRVHAQGRDLAARSGELDLLDGAQPLAHGDALDRERSRLGGRPLAGDPRPDHRGAQRRREVLAELGHSLHVHRVFGLQQRGGLPGGVALRVHERGQSAAVRLCGLQLGDRRGVAPRRAPRSARRSRPGAACNAACSAVSAARRALASLSARTSALLGAVLERDADEARDRAPGAAPRRRVVPWVASPAWLRARGAGCAAAGRATPPSDAHVMTAPATSTVTSARRASRSFAAPAMRASSARLPRSLDAYPTTPVSPAAAAPRPP